MLCTIIEGQRYSKRLNERQVTELLRATCQRHRDREDSIMKMVAANNYNNDVLTSKEFVIRLKLELTTIEAHVLPPPMLQYHKSGRESHIEPFVGHWNMINKTKGSWWGKQWTRKRTWWWTQWWKRSWWRSDVEKEKSGEISF